MSRCVRDELCSEPPRGYSLRGLVLASTIACLGCLLAGGNSALAAVTHEFLPSVSAKITEGVPSSSGESLPGTLSSPSGSTVDEGHLWVSEKIEGTSETRVDEFDDVAGEFRPPQLLPGGAFSQFSQSVAVGHATGEEEVYVQTSRGQEDLVAVFGPSSGGTRPLQSTWTGAGTTNGSFVESGGETVGEVAGVAVDGSSNSLEDWAAGDVYVETHRLRSYEGTTEFQNFNTVDVFTPAAGGTEPGKVVAQISGTCPAPGTCTGAEVVPFVHPGGIAVSALNGDVMVIDADSVVDVFAPTGLGEYAFVRQLTGTPEGSFGEVDGVAVDGGDGDVYVIAGSNVVDQFDAEGSYLGHIIGTPAGPFERVGSIAVDGASHHVYVGDRRISQQIGVMDVFGPSVVVPNVVTGAASAVSATSVTFNGTVDPEGAGSASCEFMWGATRAFGHVAPCTQAVPNGNGPVPVHATVTAEDGLEPGTAYFYRLEGSNANGTNPGEASEDGEVLTGGPGLRGESVSNVSAVSATFEAAIDPNGHATSYRFVYGPTTAYGFEVPSAPGVAIGAGTGEVQVSQHTQVGLTPGTLYHYRVVAESEGQAFLGPDQTFTTQAVGAGFVLPDSRQWEMVSPADKKGAQISQLGESVTQAAASGAAITFEATSTTEAQPEGYANIVQILAARGSSGGWGSRDIASPHEAATGIGSVEYRGFSEDLTLGVLQPAGPFTRALSPDASEQTAYLRTNVLRGSPGSPCTADCYEPLVTGCPAVGECAPSVREHADVPEGTMFGEEGQCPSPPPSKKEQCGPEFIGGSPDLSHVILKSTAALTPGANSGGALYEWAAGRLSLVSVLPKGEPATSSPNIGRENKVARHAVSNDGSRVVWSERGSHLYLRVNSTQPQSPLNAKGECTVTTDACTVLLDAPTSGASTSGSPDPRFQVASADDSRVFFTDDQELTADAGVEGNLYECTIVVEAGAPQCQLTDLTPKGGAGEPPGVRDLVIGASEDGSWVYFVADGALAAGAAQGNCGETAEGAPEGVSCNLYVWHEGVTRLVAVLSEADFPDWNGHRNPFDLVALTARVSPDGQWLAFMSQRSLTGYDTRDLNTGEPDEEVYLYNAVAKDVVCASCDPSGARPAGVKYGAMIQNAIGNAIWENDQGLAGSLPAWTAYSGVGEARYQPRFLSDSGRLFFNSSDALVAEDGNGVGDVYEFEPLGVGGCSSLVSSGSVQFVPEAGGCVGLISSGTSSEESTFLDASQDGTDAFFMTGAKLSPADFDTSADIYDAHVCSTSAPCAAAGPQASMPCESEDACKGILSRQSQSFGVPPTAGASGPGNPVEMPLRHLSRAQLLAKALRACHAKGKKRRAACERSARRRYGAKRVGLPAAIRACHAKRGGARSACERTAHRRYARFARQGNLSGRGRA